ncbi:MAG: inverse autotransporter beta domain-containing protein, partial [Hafnia sp.]
MHSTGRLLNVPGDENINISTRKYTLKAGETVFTVARDYNISLTRLFRLNDHRKYPEGFDSLRPGDEIMVPDSLLWRLPSLDLKAAGQNKEAALGDSNGAEIKLAQTASQAGSFFAASPGSHEASAFLRSSVSGAATASVQQWLSKVGTAQVRLDVDDKFSLKNSQAEILVPLYDNNQWLTFTQGALHHTDSRNQSNLGVGIRHFTADYMTGGNIFMDYDLSRSHARMGMGGEYWRDYLKLSANSYLRLTNWKDAPELEDYEARPANGWDIRAQGWLPALPQLGGKLIFEKYYGREVGLFGKDKRQNNPYALTAGINYTPFPLLALNAEQRQGQSGANDTRLGLQVNYQLGVPWHRQLASDAVRTLRTLAGSRYDLVERNNNIILDYRKKEVIRLFTHPLVTGYAGQEKSLGVSVNSKYGLERINWSASALLAAGGKLVEQGTEWSVVLPELNAGADAVNTYNLTAVAVDKKGNVSEAANTQVTVVQAAINAGTSTFSPSAVSLAANGKTQKLTLKINDSASKPVDIAANEISIEMASTSGRYSKTNATVSHFTRIAAGEYAATLTTGTTPEVFTLTASARNVRVASLNVTITADNATAMISRLTVVADGALADGRAANKLNVLLVDASNNPIGSQPVSLKATNGAVVPASVITDAKGEATVAVTSVRAGEAIVIGGVNGKDYREAKLMFRADKASARVVDKDLTITPDTAVADGKTTKTLKVKVTDALGNPVPDMIVEIGADNDAQLALKRIKTDMQGIATTTLVSKIAGTTKVKVAVNNTTTIRDTLFTGHAATAVVASVSTPHASGVADGKSPMTFHAIIRDQHGNLLSGIPVDWKSEKDSSFVVFSKEQSHTNAQGVAETTLTSTKAYSDVVVTASTNASSRQAAPVAFIADTGRGTVKHLSSDRKTLSANGTDAGHITVQIEDSHGNRLKGVKVTLRNKEGAVIRPEQPVTDASGVAVASMTTVHAGQVNIEASLENGAKKALSLLAEADMQSATVSVNASSTTATAGQVVPVNLTATVRDANNNPVSGTSVSWQTDHNKLNLPVSVSDSDGKAVIKLSGTEAVSTTVTAVLYNGNIGIAKVSFAPGKVNNGSLTLSPQTITADGIMAATATLMLKDLWGNPVPGQAIAWSSDEASIRFAASETGQGIYKASVTGTKEGTWGVIARSGEVNLQTSLGLLASQSSALIDRVTVAGSATAKANGIETVTLRVQVKDLHGNTNLKGVAVGWDAAYGVFSSRVSHTNDQGVAEITLSSRRAGKVRVSAMLGGGKPVSADKEITFSTGGVDADKSDVNIVPATLVAGKDHALVTLTARDAEGNLLTGLKDRIQLHFSPDAGMATTLFTEVDTGIYQVKVTGKKVGSITMTAVIDSMTLKKSVSLSIREDNSSAVIKGAIAVSHIRTEVGQMVTYTAMLTDLNGNALKAGVPVTWSANEGSVLTAQVSQTDSSGVARATLTRYKAG